MEIRSGSARHLMIIGFVGTLLAACGGGGGSNNSPPPPAPDTQAPTAKINFPTAQALTTADSITVTGTAADPEGNTISSVTVNGAAATSTNGFANWAATVSLTAGDNTITVETADDQGNSEASAASITIKNEVALLNPNDIALDSAASRALLVDEVLRAVIAVDLGTGQRSVVSGVEQGSGTVFNTPSTIALDSTNNRVLVGDGTQILAVSLATGDRSVFTDLGAGNQALDLTLDENNSRVLVVTTSGVLTVPSTGGSSSDFSSAT
ncbi:MAG: cadherin-like beta sandwich domain-containing protein, partial [Pseudomonadales bacterium]